MASPRAHSQSACRSVVERPTADPGPGEVQVRIHLRPINPADVYGITGAHPSFKPAALPAVPGGEGASFGSACGSGLCLHCSFAALPTCAALLTGPGGCDALSTPWYHHVTILVLPTCMHVRPFPVQPHATGVLMAFLLRLLSRARRKTSTAPPAGMGTIAKVGAGVTAFHPGQRVVGMPWSTKIGDGSWQQCAVVREGALVAVPDAVSDEAAAQFAVNPLTAYGLLDVSSEALLLTDCCRPPWDNGPVWFLLMVTEVL